jgi:hypothetical protein
MNDKLLHNRLTLKNTGAGFSELLKLFTKTNDKDPTPFNSLIPMPKEIWDTQAFFSDDKDIQTIFSDCIIYDKKYYGEKRDMTLAEVREHQPIMFTKKYLYEKYGVLNWRQWAIKNWGSSWDASAIEITMLGNEEALIKFDSYGSYPDAVYVAISKKYPLLTFAIDIYCNDYKREISAAIVYGPDYPFSRERLCSSELANQLGCQALLLSEEIIEFCKRFKKFPISAYLLREFKPNDEPSCNVGEE